MSLKSILLPIVYVLAIVRAAPEWEAKLVPNNHLKVKAKYEELIYQSMKSIVSLDELVTSLSVQVAQLTTSLSEVRVDVRKLGDQSAKTNKRITEGFSSIRTETGNLKTSIVETNARVDKVDANLTTSLSEVRVDVSKLEDQSAKTNKRLTEGLSSIRTNLSTSLSEVRVDVRKLGDQSAKTNKRLAEGFSSIRTEIGNLKTSIVATNARVNKVENKEVAVVAAEQRIGNNKCVKVCAGTTGRMTTNWNVYGSNGMFMDVDISRCGYVKVPTVTTSIEGSANHWMALGTSSVYDVKPSRFRIYLRTSVSTTRAKNYKWNVEWIAVGYTC